MVNHSSNSSKRPTKAYNSLKSEMGYFSQKASKNRAFTLCFEPRAFTLCFEPRAFTLCFEPRAFTLYLPLQKATLWLGTNAPQFLDPVARDKRTSIFI